MILSAHDGRWRVVTQNDHAHLAAEILGLWRGGGLPEHPRRRQILLAAREHDNGWREADSAPRCDPASGRPLDFLSIPEELRRRLWQRGVERFREREPWTAALIVQHALQLHRTRDADPAWRELLAGWRRLREDLLEEAGSELRELERDYCWIELSDTLSLGLCSRWRQALELHGHAIELEGDAVRIAPFPLAGTTTFRLPCRHVPDRRYASDADLGVELAGARWREAAVRLVFSARKNEASAAADETANPEALGR